MYFQDEILLGVRLPYSALPLKLNNPQSFYRKAFTGSIHKEQIHFFVFFDDVTKTVFLRS